MAPPAGCPVTVAGSATPELRAFSGALAVVVCGTGIVPDRSGFDSTIVGLSGEVSATSGGVVLLSATTTVTLSCERARVPSGAIDCSTISCDPGGNGGGTSANAPLSSARARKYGSPSRSNSMVAPGAARPAMTLSPFGSTRTMSNDGMIGAGAAGAGVDSFSKMPAAWCREAPESGTVGVGALESAVGDDIPVARPSIPGVRGAWTMPNQLIRETSPTATRIATAVRPCARCTNLLRPSVLLTRHQNMSRNHSP